MRESPRSPIPVDVQQARLLERLRAARGRAVSFEELRSLGIENPAVLCYELDLVGIPIARVHRYEVPGHAVPVGVRIEDFDSATEVLEPSASPGKPSWSPLPRWRRSAHQAREFVRAGLRSASAAATVAAGSDRRRVLVATILIVVVAVGATLVFTAHSGRPRAHLSTTDHRVLRAPTQASARRASPLLGGAGTKANSAASVGAAGSGGSARAVDHAPALSGTQPQPGHKAAVVVYSSAAAQLEAHGHQLLGEAHYAAAIGALHAALAASGQSSARCGVPGTEACLTYAYALYDLGRALRLNGEPRAAVGVLTERLHIDNQRAAVQKELEQARAAAGAGGSGAGRTPEAVRTPKRVAQPEGHARHQSEAHPQGPAPSEGQPGANTLTVVPSQPSPRS